MKGKTTAILALVFSISLISIPAAARNVVINNQRMNDVQLQYLDSVSCSYIPDGNYWLDVTTGMWGYAGGGMQGYISDNCNQRKPSLSERGLLYSPGELLR